ncbi:MAG TPA: hypothetical protein DEB06_10080, partial [Phycisphaerales bacterium]|nr:hypothetical protein [Phycisphaerales bacterium]
MTEAIGPETPGHQAAEEALARLLADVADRLRALRRRGIKRADRVHRFRVATRRASAALRLFHDWVDDAHWQRIRRTLRRLRREAGAVRSADVHLHMLRDGLGGQLDPSSREVRSMARSVRRSRKAGRAALARRLDRRSVARLERRTDRLLASIRTDGPGREPFENMAQRWLGASLPELVDACDRSASDREAFHPARLVAKRLRYGVEILAPCFAPEGIDAALLWATDLQDRMGEVNDLEELQMLVSTAARERPDGAMPALEATLAARAAQAYARYAQWWKSSGRGELARVFGPMMAGIRAPHAPRPPPAPHPPPPP